MASPFHDKTEDIFKDRRLPSELKRKFDAAGVSRSEQNDFLDRLERVFPSEEELTQLSNIPNPWALLAELEGRINEPERVARRVKLERKLSIPSPQLDAPPSEAQPTPPNDSSLATPSKIERPPATPPPSTKRELSKAGESSEPRLALLVSRLTEQEVRDDLNRLRLAYNLDAPGTSPEKALASTMLEFYNLLVEARNRFESVKKIS